MFGAVAQRATVTFGYRGEQRTVDPWRLGFTRGALAARREHVRPLLPEIGRGGDFVVRGKQAVSVTWAAGGRQLVLDANLSAARVAFPPAGGVFWRCGETDREFGPWSVRWSVSP